MKKLALIAALFCPSHAGADSYPDADRIVSIGGPVTEVIYALGQEHRIVARDTTSVYPPEANQLPDVGYMRRLSAEGVLSVDPDLIITRDTAGPVEALDQLRAASVPMVEVHDAFSADAVIATIRTVGEALGEADAAEELVKGVEAALEQLYERTNGKVGPRVLFILSNRGGRLNVAGSGTGANGIIELAGAQNVMAAEFSSYKIASDEAIISAAPDVILMMAGRAGTNHEARRDEIMSIPAIKLTPAGRNGAFATVDGAALGFGPRTPALALELNETLNAFAQK